MGKVWFITGVSRGLGREWASAALDRGDRVAGTARDLAAVADLVDSAKPPLRLLLGDTAVRIVTQEYESGLAVWREWQSVSTAAQGN